MIFGTAGVPPATLRRSEIFSRFALIAGGTPAVPAARGPSLGINQVVQSLGPILIEALQNVVLL